MCVTGPVGVDGAFVEEAAAEVVIVEFRRYVVRRFGPPHISLVFPLQVIEQPLSTSVAPVAITDPALNELPQ